MLLHGFDEPFGRLIVSGCDQRLIPAADGLNPYGASILPRRAIALGSCSCSSPSDRATQASRRALESLRRSSNIDRTISTLNQQTRRTLHETLELAPEVEIALTPSGTDVEILAAAIVAGVDERELVNVVVGPGEVGSGTCNAAAVRHYSTRLPRGGKAILGEPVAPGLASRVTLATVDIRDSHGEMFLPLEIDGVVTDIVIGAIERGARVLVHLVANSKTGIHAPSLPLMERLTQTMGPDVVGIVDAAQGRLAPESYQSALDRGLMVSFSGSKFYGGPPFAGALFVPPNLSPADTGIDSLPSGFADYFNRRHLPDSWFPVGLQDEWINVGSLLRWAGAAAEMNAYFRVDQGERQQIAQAFATTIGDCFADMANIRMVKPFLCHDADGTLENVESTPTIFSFELTDDAGNPLDFERLKQIHGQLNTEVEGTRFHLGQPVRISDRRAVLRVALGAPLIVDLATERSLGASLDARIDSMKQMIRHLAEQIQRLAKTADVAQPS